MASGTPAIITDGSPPDDSTRTGLGLGLGLGGLSERSTNRYSYYDPRSLSPLSEDVPPHRRSQSSSANLSPTRFSSTALSPTSPWLPPPMNNENARDPFNFQTVSYTAARTPSLSNTKATALGQRRGHKYKHSSISAQHQIFQEPSAKTPLQLPASLPIPSFRECYASLTPSQASRVLWCLCHLSTAAFVQWRAGGSLALTALSHLLMFDFLGALCCVTTDVLGNFDVWSRSSIRHPFGLERLEVVAGFAMSVFLAFMGFDLITHGLKHALEDVGGHESHHPHEHTRISAGSLDSTVLLAIGVTLVSAYLLRNHERIGRAMRFASPTSSSTKLFASLPGLFSNPSHFLTLSCSLALLVLPLLSLHGHVWLDRAISLTIAICMCGLGTRLVVTLGYMLLMSYRDGLGVAEIIGAIESEPTVVAVDDARFWQVHYGLCMANLKIRARGRGDDVVEKVRETVRSLIRNRLAGGYGGVGGGVRWEVSTQVVMVRD